MRAFSLLFVMLGFLQVRPAVAQPKCMLTPAERKVYLSMPYQEFDQTPGKGWRYWGEENHCFQLGSELLDSYRELHKSTLLDWQVRVMIWHSGQLLAMDGNERLAKEKFLQSFEPNEPIDTPIRWNDYIHATLAFLDHDRPRLQFYRDRIAKGPVCGICGGKIANLNIVDAFLKCFDQPYSVAYGGCRSKLSAF